MTEILTKVALMKKLEIIIKPGKLDVVKKAMTAAGYTGLTISKWRAMETRKACPTTTGTSGWSFA